MIRFPINEIKVKLYFWITNREIDFWVNHTQLFFVHAIGRSGTKFLANLLGKGSATAIFHEPVHEDYKAYLRAFHSSEDAMVYIRKFRKKDIYLRARGNKTRSYGEVNSLLRRHVKALNETFPNAVMIHLVRDGRDVVRSMVSRKTMTAQDKNTLGIYPHQDDPYRSNWERMDRFSRICWYWQVENSFLRKNLSPSVKFEDIIQSYDVFYEKILDPCNLIVPKKIWSEYVNSPNNKTKKYLMPPWIEWSKEQKHKFQEICGEEMIMNGYGI